MTQREFVRNTIKERHAITVGAIADQEALKTGNHTCDVIELRLDSLGISEEVINFAKNCEVPLLITARGAEEGGQADWSLTARQAAYDLFMPYAAAIDIELRDLEALAEIVESAKAEKVTIVGSFHNFEKTPPLAELRGKLGEVADIHKFALRVNGREDLAAMLDLLDNESLLSVMGMGPLGAAARPLMAKAGSLLNYGYLGETPTAPDQWPAGLLKETLSI